MVNKKQLGGSLSASVIQEIDIKHGQRRERYEEEKARKKAMEKAIKEKQIQDDIDSIDPDSRMDIIKIVFRQFIRNIKETFQNVKAGFIGYIIVPILFASIAPALPLFLFMAGLFAVLKYFMGYLKKI